MRTRILLGAVLAILAGGMFFVDHRAGKFAPILGVVSVALTICAALEVGKMVPASRRPNAWLAAGGAGLLVAVSWLRFVSLHFTPTEWRLGLFVALVLVAMIEALVHYRGVGESTNRLALTVFTFAYLGLLPGFLVELRLQQPDEWNGTASLLLAVFVTKGCDIGAYFTGKMLGRHKMTPVLSPNKTWEGLAGGLALATAIACALQAWQPVIPFGWPGTIAFGLSVGVAGVLGDLVESLLKRDGGVKDAASLLPEFGGILDVVDAILFAAPLVYWWLRVLPEVKLT